MGDHRGSEVRCEQAPQPQLLSVTQVSWRRAVHVQYWYESSARRLFCSARTPLQCHQHHQMHAQLCTAEENTWRCLFCRMALSMREAGDKVVRTPAANYNFSATVANEKVRRAAFRLHTVQPLKRILRSLAQLRISPCPAALLRNC